jgi:hypothetical protein
MMDTGIAVPLKQLPKVKIFVNIRKESCKLPTKDQCYKTAFARNLLIFVIS